MLADELFYSFFFTEESIEQAIVAAQELASQQPSYLSARPMSQQQKVTQEKRKLLWSGKNKKVGLLKLRTAF